MCLFKGVRNLFVINNFEIKDPLILYICVLFLSKFLNFLSIIVEFWNKFLATIQKLWNKSPFNLTRIIYFKFFELWSTNKDSYKLIPNCFKLTYTVFKLIQSNSIWASLKKNKASGDVMRQFQNEFKIWSSEIWIYAI